MAVQGWMTVPKTIQDLHDEKHQGRCVLKVPTQKDCLCLCLDWSTERFTQVGSDVITEGLRGSLDK